MSNLSITRDTMLGLLKNEYAVSFSQKVVAQWNYNRHSTPLIYGYYRSNSSDQTYANSSVQINNMYTIDTSVKTVTMTNNAPVSIGTYSTSMNSLSAASAHNIVRIMFDAKINSVSSAVTEPMSEFMIKITPKSSGTNLTDFIDMQTVSLTENVYRKQEIMFASNYFDIDRWFDQVILEMVPLSQISAGSVVVNIKNVCISPVTRDEVEEGQFEKLSGAFKYNRPGDQILENDLITSSVNPITKYFVATTMIDENINNPEILTTLLSPFNESIYFLGPPSKEKLYSYNTSAGSFTPTSVIRNGHNIFVEYENTASVNQIYIKTQNFSGILNPKKISTIDKAEVYLKDNSGWSSTPIYSVTSGSLIQNGAIVLQYNGATWSAGYDVNTLPEINPTTGRFTIATKEVKAIHVVLYANDPSSRMRVVEISPRLAVDLSNFVISVNNEVIIDDGNQRVPVGLANVSSGEVVLENLPRWTNPTSESGSLYQIFDNNTNSTFNGLIKPDAKITSYSTIVDTKTGASTATIKNFTMYATEWSGKDTETISIKLDDYGRLMQSMSAPDLLLTTNHNPKRNGDIQKSLEAMFQLGGFSDYDITSLKNISDKVARGRKNIPVFYSSHENKIWQVMSDMLLGYQVSAFFDENGIMQFRDITRETSSYSSYSDGSSYYITSSAINGYLPNIVSFSDEKKPDIGEITINYKEMSVSNNLYDANGRILDAKDFKVEGTFFRQESNSTTPAWSSPGNKALICANIVSNIGVSDNCIVVGDFNHIDKRDSRFVTDFKGYGIIEGEIVSWDGIKYQFSPVSGFPTYQIVRSQDELLDEVSQRFNSINSKTSITSCRAVGNNIIAASFSAPPILQVGQSVYLSLYASTTNNNTVILRSLFEDSARVVAQATSTASFEISPTRYSNYLGRNINGASVLTKFQLTDLNNSYVRKSETSLNYTMTGSLCNVRRGLFGTSAMEHFSQNYYDSSAFVGYGNFRNGPTNMKIGRVMEKKIEADNATNFPLATPAGSITYLGFYNRDSRLYTHYRYKFTPKADLDSFGIFFGASVLTTGAGSARFVSNSTSANRGIFIDFYPPTETKQPYGVVVRRGVDPDNPSRLYYSKQKLLNDKWKKDYYKTVVVKDKDGKPVKDEKGVTKTKRVLVKTPPRQNVIDVYFENEKIILIRVNGTRVKLNYIKNANTKREQEVPAPVPLPLTINRRSTTFGIFSRNTDSNSTKLNIQEIQAVPAGVHMDKTSGWSGEGISDSVLSVNSMLMDNVGRTAKSNVRSGGTGFKHPVKPFSLRATPFIRGIEINNEKWEGDFPYYDLYAQKISGINGKQIVQDNDVATSIVLGTPFRGRWAHKNEDDEVIFTSANLEGYIDSKIYGKSISVLGDRKLTRLVDNYQAGQALELDIAWCDGEQTAEQVLFSLSKNINQMNNVYSVEIYGNPALRVGDYVVLHYPEANIIQKKVVIVSIDNNFSDGGISTSLRLRPVNINF
jgi:hypothetical protein